MLEVVKHEQRMTVGDLLELTRADGADDRRSHELRRRERCKRDEEHAARKVVEKLRGHLKR